MISDLNCEPLFVFEVWIADRGSCLLETGHITLSQLAGPHSGEGPVNMTEVKGEEQLLEAGVTDKRKVLDLREIFLEEGKPSRPRRMWMQWFGCPLWFKSVRQKERVRGWRGFWGFIQRTDVAIVFLDLIVCLPSPG